MTWIIWAVICLMFAAILFWFRKYGLERATVTWDLEAAIRLRKISNLFRNAYRVLTVVGVLLLALYFVM